jgi:hypothetical protein
MTDADQMAVVPIQYFSAKGHDYLLHFHWHYDSEFWSVRFAILSSSLLLLVALLAQDRTS